MVATTGWRTEFLTQMGLAIPESVTGLAVDQQRAFIPRDKIKSVLGAADVLVWTTESDKDQSDLLADPDVAALRRAACSPPRIRPGQSPTPRR